MQRLARSVVLMAVSINSGMPAGVALAVAAPEAQPSANQGSPLSGSWEANIAKSKRHPNHLFQSATLQFVVAGDTVTLTHGGVNAGGQQESGTLILQADGKERPVSEQSPNILVVTKWVGPRLLATVAKNKDAVIGEQSYEVSADGKTLTAKVWGTDASGARFDHVIVFDRK